MTIPEHGQRDFIGYGGKPPYPRWPGEARLALAIVLNVEEGAEPSIPDGDPATELALSDGIAGEVPAGSRDFVAESLFEYGSRAGFWRLLDLFQDQGIAATMNVCARALERNPEIAEAIRLGQFDLCCHGDRFARHYLMSEEEEEERAVIARAVFSLKQTIGRAPLGWQSRYSPSAFTRPLLAGHGGFLYDADSYADDLPYWVRVKGQPHLVIPHSFTNNDNRLASGKLGTGLEFCEHLCSAFRVLYAEGKSRPKMMTVSLHCRVSGQPARFEGIAQFIGYVLKHDGVWIAGRSEIARHWIATHPAGGEQ
jgi:peptidoglycan/xylan/chitin deacetylase (PgdA/CDA1 family)